MLTKVTRRETFMHLVNWIQDVKQHGNDSIKTVLVANKCDLESKRQVTKQEGEEFALKHRLLYLETSAKTGYQVDQAFVGLANHIYETLQLSRDNSQLSGHVL